MGDKRMSFWSVTAASEYLHLHPDTTRRFVREGMLEAYLIGNKYLISNESIEAYLANGRGKFSKAGKAGQRAKKAEQAVGQDRRRATSSGNSSFRL